MERGILASLEEQLGTDACSAGAVTITPSDALCGNYKNLIKYGWLQHWFSFFGENPWIELRFEQSTAKIHGYTLQTYSGDPGCAHLKSWVFEVKVNDEWREQDRRENSDDLNSPAAIVRSDFPPIDGVRAVRVRMIGKNHHDGNIMVLRRIELFGSLN